MLISHEKNHNKSIIIILTLIVLVLAIYWQVQSFEFVNYDDDVYVTENMHVYSGITKASIKWAFTSTYASFWHPLTWLSLMLDYELFKLNAGGYHWTNLLLHIISTVLLFLVLNKMTGSFWRSGFVAALFALHPLHVESVAWIAQRKDVLSGVFWMLTMYAYLAYTSRPNIRRYFLILLVFVLGLMSKPMLVTLPFVLLLLDYWPLNRFTFELKQDGENKKRKLNIVPIGEGNSISRLILEKVPLFVLSMIFSVIVFITEQKDSALASLESLSLFARISNALVSYVEYISKMIIPVNLAVFYPHPGMWPLWQVLLCLVVLISITYIVIFYIKKYPYLAVGWFWYLGTLIPVIGLVQVGSFAMADRYTYITLTGLFIMIAWCVPDIMRRWRCRRSILLILSTFIFVSLTVCTWVQVQYWENGITLFQHTIDVTKDNSIILNNLGNALARKGRMEEAMIRYNKAILIQPNAPDVYISMGKALSLQGNVHAAIIQYKKALKLKPQNVKAHFNIGVAYSEIGQLDEAAFHYSEAIKMNPDFFSAYNNLGIVYARLGKIDLAILNFQKALMIFPNYQSAMNNLRIAIEQKKSVSLPSK